MGATGMTGSVVTRVLLERGYKVRVLGRKKADAEKFVHQGAEFAFSDLNDSESFEESLKGASVVYVMHPPALMEEDLIEAAVANTAVIKQALVRQGVRKVVLLSSIGAHQTKVGNIRILAHMESELRKLPIDLSIVRAGAFMENYKRLVPAVKNEGILPSMFIPFDKPVEMVATEDIGRVAAELIMSDKKNQLIELGGPVPLSANDVAASFSKVLGKPVKTVPVPTSEYAEIFKSMPSKTIECFIEMYEAFNSGNCKFEGGDFKLVRGKVTIDEFVAKLCGEEKAA